MELLRPSSLAEIDGGVPIHGGTEVVPLLRDGILSTDRLVDIRAVIPRGVDGRVIGAGTTLAELAATRTSPRAPRGVPARRLAAAPQHELDRRQPAAVDALLVLAAQVPVQAARRRPLPRAGGGASRARDLRERLLCVRAPFRRRRRAPRARRATAHDEARAASRRAVPAPDEGDRSLTALEPGELILELELPAVEASTYLKAMDRKRWAFPQVGVAAARTGGETRLALAGVAPIPWLLDGLRRRDAAAPHRLEGRRRAGARRARAAAVASSEVAPAPDVIYAVVLAAGASSRYGTAPPKQQELLPRVLAALRALARRRPRRRHRRARARDRRGHGALRRLGARPGRVASLRPRRAAAPRPRPRSSSSPTGPTSTRGRSTASSTLAGRRRRRRSRPPTAASGCTRSSSHGRPGAPCPTRAPGSSRPGSSPATTCPLQATSTSVDE